MGEFVVFILVLSILGILLTVSKMALQNVEYIEELSRVNLYYRKKIKNLAEQKSRLERVNSQLRSAQRKLEQELSDLKSETDNVRAVSTMIGGNLKMVNSNIRQQNSTLSGRSACEIYKREQYTKPL